MESLLSKEGSQKLLEPRVIRLEVNLLGKPFFVLARKQLPMLLRKTLKEKKSQVRYEEKVVTEEGTLRRIWEVHPSATWGYAGPFDKEVFMAVHRLITTEVGLPVENPVKIGSLYKLCSLMELANSGKNKKRIKEALIRIGSNSIYTENTFYLRSERRYWRSGSKLKERGGSFTLWSVYWKGNILPDGRKADAIYLYLNPPYIISLNNYYIKPIDYDYYSTLKSIIARRLYEILGLKFYGLRDSPYVRFEYSTLCQLLPIAQQKFLSLAQQVLLAAHEELIETDFLAEVEWEEQKPWFINYYPGDRALEEIAKVREVQTDLVLIEPSPPMPTPTKEDYEIKALVEDILEITRDEKSRAFYAKVAKVCPSDLIYRVLSEVKDEYHRGTIKKSKGALFTDKLKRYCKEWGIDLGLRRSSS